MELLSVDNC